MSHIENMYRLAVASGLAFTLTACGAAPATMGRLVVDGTIVPGPSDLVLKAQGVCQSMGLKPGDPPKTWTVGNSFLAPMYYPLSLNPLWSDSKGRGKVTPYGGANLAAPSGGSIYYKPSGDVEFQATLRGIPVDPENAGPGFEQEVYIEAICTRLD